MKRIVAEHTVKAVRAELGYLCERMEVAGSVRRGVKDPHDLELVYIPHTLPGPRQIVMELGTCAEVPPRPVHNLTEARISRLVALGWWAWDTERPCNGPKVKRLVRDVEDPNWWQHKWEETARVVIELYRADRLNWGYILALRTGPVEFVKLLVTKRSKGGAMPSHLRVEGGYLRAVRKDPRDGDVVPVAQEEEFFRQVGLPCWIPEDRTRAVLAEYLAGEPVLERRDE